MNKEEAEKHWEYTEQIILIMMALAKYLYIQALIHNVKHEEQEGDK